MAAAAAEAAGLEEIDLDQNLLELGLDSLRAAEFASQACTRFLGVFLPSASGASHSVCVADIAVFLSSLASASLGGSIHHGMPLYRTFPLL